MKPTARLCAVQLEMESIAVLWRATDLRVHTTPSRQKREKREEEEKKTGALNSPS